MKHINIIFIFLPTILIPIIRFLSYFFLKRNIKKLSLNENFYNDAIKDCIILEYNFLIFIFEICPFINYVMFAIELWSLSYSLNEKKIFKEYDETIERGLKYLTESYGHKIDEKELIGLSILLKKNKNEYNIVLTEAFFSLINLIKDYKNILSNSNSKADSYKYSNGYTEEEIDKMNKELINSIDSFLNLYRSLSNDNEFEDRNLTNKLKKYSDFINRICNDIDDKKVIFTNR